MACRDAGREEDSAVLVHAQRNHVHNAQRLELLHCNVPEGSLRRERSQTDRGRARTPLTIFRIVRPGAAATSHTRKGRIQTAGTAVHH
jgi:hypothetical protein